MRDVEHELERPREALQFALYTLLVADPDDDERYCNLSTTRHLAT